MGDTEISRYTTERPLWYKETRENAKILDIMEEFWKA